MSKDNVEESGAGRSGSEGHSGERAAEVEGGPDVDALLQERNEIKDLLLRKQAEFENYRKRTERERSEFVQYATSELMTGILDVLDSFERALAEETGGDARVENMRLGFQLIYKQLLDSLKKYGLEPIESIGRPFDPYIHEAVATEVTPEFPEGAVISEVRRGYLLNGKLLRAAAVTVAAAPQAGSRAAE